MLIWWIHRYFLLILVYSKLVTEKVDGDGLVLPLFLVLYWIPDIFTPDIFTPDFFTLDKFTLWHIYTESILHPTYLHPDIFTPRYVYTVIYLHQDIFTPIYSTVSSRTSMYPMPPNWVGMPSDVFLGGGEDHTCRGGLPPCFGVGGDTLLLTPGKG